VEVCGGLVVAGSLAVGGGGEASQGRERGQRSGLRACVGKLQGERRARGGRAASAAGQGRELLAHARGESEAGRCGWGRLGKLRRGEPEVGELGG
jgi:hypothetical protein